MAIYTTERFDGVIDSQLEPLYDLRAQRDSSIFRLPPETLTDIFIYCAHGYYYEDNQYQRSFVPHWVNVSYVCRHWRAIALNCPILWSYHFIASHRWTEELLARSKQASLKINVRFGYVETLSWCSQLIKKLLDQAERIQELCLDVPLVAIPLNLSLRAPRLQVLEINAHHNPYLEWNLKIDDWAIPPLRTLSFIDFPLPWHTLDLSRVTTLTLGCLCVPKQNVTELLAALSRMQALSALYLWKALPTARGSLSDAFNISSRVSLPYLTRFFIEDPLSTVAAFLSCINISSKTELRVGFPLENDSSIDGHSQISSIVTQRFSQSSSLSPTIRSLSIHSPAARRSTFTFSLSERRDCDPNHLREYPPWDCNAFLMIVVGLERATVARDRDRIVNDICCSIPLTHVETLHVVNPPPSPDFWGSILGHLHGLRRLKLSDGISDLVSCVSYASVVPPMGTSYRTSTMGHIHLPALEELDLYGIKFKTRLLGDAMSKKMLRDVLSTHEELRPLLGMINCSVEDGSSDT